LRTGISASYAVATNWAWSREDSKRRSTLVPGRLLAGCDGMAVHLMSVLLMSPSLRTVIGTRLPTLAVTGSKTRPGNDTVRDQGTFCKIVGGVLMPLLCKIAYARATDHTRRRTTRDDALVAVGQMLQGTQAGQRWQRLDPAERNEAMALIRDAIATLPGKQREVFQVFIDGYPKTRSREVLREQVSEATGREETLVSVKRALQEGRAKVGEFLRRKGYDFERRGDE
jgi:DNA-directed RNA polymerase specialized sigma24 family protein